MKHYKNALILMVMTHLVACQSMPTTVGSSSAPSSINQERGLPTTRISKAQREQYKRQQDLELREAELQEIKEMLSRQSRQGVLNHWSNMVEKSLLFAEPFPQIGKEGFRENNNDFTTYQDAKNNTPLPSPSKEIPLLSLQPSPSPKIEVPDLPTE